MIPNKELCGNLAALRFSPTSLYLGLPVEILNSKKYERKSYEFNFGLVLRVEEYEDLHKRQVYEWIVRKMAAYLTLLEVEHEFLWVPERKKYLAEIVKVLYDKMTAEESLEHVSFCVPFDYQNCIMF